MAIVVQSNRFQYEKKATNQIGPGQYEANTQFQIEKQNNCPFNQKIDLDEKKRQETTPGPGHYDINEDPYSEKILLTIQDEKGSNIIQIPRQNTVFKSKLKRFRGQSHHHKTPGPGTYFQEKNQIPKQELPKQQNIIQILKENDDYEYAPSIPCNHQAYGYTQNEKLIINSPQIVQHSGIKDDQIGPGHYDQQDCFTKNKLKDKGAGWSKQKQKKLDPFQKQQTKNEVGPGKYDPKIDISLEYKKKTISGFASGSQRIWDARKGEISNKFMQEKVKTMNKNQYDDENFDESQFEYIEDNVPGPGYYHNESTASSIKTQVKPKKYQFFGKSSQRFKHSQTQIIGPGDYETVDIKDQKSHQKVKTPFLTTQLRFEKKIPENIPGPGHYENNDNIFDNCQKKVQDLQIEAFQCKQEKVIKDEKQNIGPGYYLNPDILAFKNYQEVIAGKQNSVFQSQINRNIFQQQKAKTPNCATYDLNNFTIKKKTDVNEDYIKKAPFLTNQKRIQTAVVKSNQQNYQTRNLKDFFQTNDKPQIPFNQKDARFKPNQENKVINQIGPGQYDQITEKDWIKKTYNILYAEI